MRVLILLIFLFMTLASKAIVVKEPSAEDYSIEFFNAVNKNDSVRANSAAFMLASYDKEKLKKELDSDEKTLAFWINIYNTSVQYILKKNPALFEDRNAFFKAKQITIAGEVLSFDIIEHGILRKSKSKLSLGFFRKIKVSGFERLFRINKVDPRIHYALNCGALSCPPIVAYHSGKINEELDESVSDYLKKYCVIGEKDIKVPVLFSWFRADFGKKRGIKKFLVHYGIITKEEKKKDLKFLDYDWTLALDPYKN